MIKGIKNVLCSILVALFSFNLILSGCSKTINTVKATSSKIASIVEPSTAKKLPPYKLKWYVLEPNGIQKDNALVADAVSNYVQRKINATVDMQFIDWSYNDKLMLITASGQQFDMCFTASWWDYNTFVSKGAFLALNDLFPKYAPKTFAQINPVYKNGPVVEGQLYAIPTEQALAFAYGLLFNKKYVDKYNFDITKIKSLKDLEPMLGCIKNNETNIIPLLQGGGCNEDLLFERIGGDNLGKTIRLKKGDTKIYNQFEVPEYVDMMKLMYSWFKKGYIEKDIATENEGQLEKYTRQGIWFARESTLIPGKAAELASLYGYPIVQEILTPDYITGDDTTGSMMAISANSKDPARAMMLIELLHTDKYLLNLIKNGIEGTNYVKKFDNVIDFPAGQGANRNTYNTGITWTLGNQFLDYLRPFEDPNKWNILKKWNDSAKLSPYLGFNFDAEPVKNELATVTDLIANKYVTILKNGCSIDPVLYLPRILDELKAAGGDKIIAEKQKQLDVFLAAKKVN